MVCRQVPSLRRRAKPLGAAALLALLLLAEVGQAAASRLGRQQRRRRTKVGKVHHADGEGAAARQESLKSIVPEMTPTRTLTPMDALPGEIQRLLREGLERNADLKVARAELSVHKLAYRQALLRLFPDVSVSFIATSGDLQSDLSLAVTGSGLGASLSMSLFAGGSGWRAYEAARLYYVSGQLALSKQEEVVLLEMLTVYYEYIAAREQTVDAQKTLDEARRMAQLVQKQWEAGLAHGADVLGARVQVLSAEGELENANDILKRSRTTFNRLLDRPAHEEITLHGDLEIAAFDANLEEYLQWALHCHSDVINACIELNTAQYGLQDVKAAYLPQVSISASVSADPSQGTVGPEPLLPAGPVDWRAGIALSLNLPTLSYYYDVRQAEASVVRARHALQSARIYVRDGVSQAHIWLRGASRYLEIAHLELHYAQHNRAAHQQAYEEKLVTFDSVKRTHDELRMAQNSYYEAIRTAYSAWGGFLASVELTHNIVAGIAKRGPHVSAPIATPAVSTDEALCAVALSKTCTAGRTNEQPSP